MDAPVALMMRLAGAQARSSLPESVTGCEVRGRCSIIEMRTDLVWECHGRVARARRHLHDDPDTFEEEEDPLASLRGIGGESRRIDLPDRNWLVSEDSLLCGSCCSGTRCRRQTGLECPGPGVCPTLLHDRRHLHLHHDCRPWNSGPEQRVLLDQPLDPSGCPQLLVRAQGRPAPVQLTTGQHRSPEPLGMPVAALAGHGFGGIRTVPVVADRRPSSGC